jgi:leucyl aminopeptidase (aminopeptidase T)
MSSSPLERAASTTIECLGVTTDEPFLVVYNDELAEIAAAVERAARARTTSVTSLRFTTLTRNGEEPPSKVADALLEARAAALITVFSISHTEARLAATRRGVRIASMPAITPATFLRAIPVDYRRLESAGRRLAALLGAAERCRITSPAGTDVEIVLGGREGRSDDGDLRASGAFGNLPAGEAYIAPVEREGAGTIVFDGSLGSWGLLAEPVSVALESGRAAFADGGTAGTWLLATLDAGGPNGRQIAELGIGTNPAAAMVGAILEDEKVEGTIHIAFGTNTGIGGENAASVHIDGLVRDPTVELDGRTIMDAGSLVA